MFREEQARNARAPRPPVGCGELIGNAEEHSPWDAERLAGRIEAALRSAGLRHPVARVERLVTLQRHERTGKLTRFVPL